LVGTVKRALITTLQRDAQTRLQASISFAPPPAEPGIFKERTPVDKAPTESHSHDFYDKDVARADVPRESLSDNDSAVDVHDWSTPVMPEAATSASASTEFHVIAETSNATSVSWQNTRRAANQADARLIPLLHAPVERLRVLAQLDRAFILATDGRAIVLVDQHAAHERIAYEAIANAALATEDTVRIAQQPLLVPELFECSHSDAAALDASLDALQQAGVELEAFGERVYRLTAMPAILATRHFNIRGYIDDLDEETPDLDARERVWATMACHSVVRAGETMQHDEMQVVVDRLALCANPMHCPHGRPTIVRLEAPAIARMFRRV
jgi:DNA mismatch repair ATPase MutL